MDNSAISPIYLDHAAATPVLPHTLDLFRRYAEECFANQEAIHQLAYQLRKKMQEHDDRMLHALCGEKNGAFIQWTDSGTASLCAIMAHPCFSDGEIVTSDAEHAALTAAINRRGGKVKKVRLRRGLVDLEHLDSLLTASTRLVALHHVQSETGARQDLAAIRGVIDRKAPQAMFLADTTQSAGKLDLCWNEARLDFAIVSGYKVGAPGGGAAICREQTMKNGKMSDYFLHLRKREHLISRPNPALSLTLAQTLTDAAGVMGASLSRVAGINLFLREELLRRFAGKIKFVVDEVGTSPYILHFLLPGYQGAVLVRLMSERKVYIASGSACNAETMTPSPALLASGVSPKEAFAGIRVSFSPMTTDGEVVRFLDVFEDCVRSY